LKRFSQVELSYSIIATACAPARLPRRPLAAAIMQQFGELKVQGELTECAST